MRNPAGMFVKASLDSIIAAVARAHRLQPLHPECAWPRRLSDQRLHLDPHPGTVLRRRKREAILQFLRWMLTSGQKECEALGYGPHPRRIVTRELDPESVQVSRRARQFLDSTRSSPENLGSKSVPEVQQIEGAERAVNRHQVQIRLIGDQQHHAFDICVLKANPTSVRAWLGVATYDCEVTRCFHPRSRYCARTASSAAGS